MSYNYKIFATDPNGNESPSLTVPFVAPSSGGLSTYGSKVVADGASLYFPLNETSGTVVYNNGKFGDADAGIGVTFGTTWRDHR